MEENNMLNSFCTFCIQVYVKTLTYTENAGLITKQLESLT